MTDFLSKPLSRRTLLKGTAMVGAGAALGFNGIFGFSNVLGQDVKDDDLQTILNVASTAELFATTHYLAAINGKLGLDDAQIAYMKAGFLAEQDHYELLTSLGGKPVVNQFYVPETLFSDIKLFTAVTELAETTFVGAYLAAVRIFGQSKDTTPFAVTCAQIATVEAEHRALIRQIGKKLANDTSYGQFTVYNVSSAVPVLQPFLDGQPADDSLGKFTGPVMPPTADDIAKIRADATKIGYDNPGVPFAAMKTMPK